ncbi:hypothetical protein CN378_15440 [Bacillus sp. AFS015802]|uniref:hypothetical protein n=1 Tax=Bacillus sp. AFS015802 TaxID=2033486 RepID=UPI000BF99BBF|nr:hypothetical protein [Bacillus sp. AFS015802]PFA64573.1 hypothetical protein CN378_15440 [Bacillus sp. AFS015802]
MSDVVSAVVAFLLLLPILILVPMKLSYKQKVLISTGALLLTLLCVLAGRVIPLYQVLIIFVLLLLLSTYFLETRVRPLFLQSTNTSDIYFTSEIKETSQQEFEESPALDTVPTTKGKRVPEKEGYIEEIPLKSISSVHILEEEIEDNVYKDEDFPSHSPFSVDEERDRLDEQLEDWNPLSPQTDSLRYDTIPSSSLSQEEEEEYNRLFFETKR